VLPRICGRSHGVHPLTTNVYGSNHSGCQPDAQAKKDYTVYRDSEDCLALQVTTV
jgi:hypothetical protein